MLQSLVGSGGRSLLVILLFWVSTSAFAENALRVAFLSAEPVQISALIDVTAQYEQLNPGVNVEVQAFSDAAFKANIDQWLENGDFDVIHWQAGQRPRHFDGGADGEICRRAREHGKRRLPCDDPMPASSMFSFTIRKRRR